MPRARRSRRSGRRSRAPRLSARNFLVNSTIRTQGRASIDMGYNASFSFNYINLAPSNFTRLDKFAEIYSQYHWNSLRISGLPYANAAAGPVAIAFLSATDVTAPSGYFYETTVAIEGSRSSFPNQTVPITLSIPGSKIHNAKRWFPTNNVDDIPGFLILGGPTSTAVVGKMLVEYDITFCSPVADGKQSVAYGYNTTGDEEKVAFGYEAVVMQQEPPPAPPTPARSVIDAPPGIRRQVFKPP